MLNKSAYAIAIDEKIFSPASHFKTVASLINTLLPNALMLAGVIFLLMLIYAGLQMVIAGQANPEKWQKTQQTLTAALVGLIVVAVAYWLVSIIQHLTGVKIFNPSDTL